MLPSLNVQIWPDISFYCTKRGKVHVNLLTIIVLAHRLKYLVYMGIQS